MIATRISFPYWQDLMQQSSIPENQGTYEKLIAAYSEKHREYHSLKHLEHVLLSFDESKHLARYPNAVELALWFHDAIYKIFAKDNEQASADWANDFLQRQFMNPQLIYEVYKHILATLHDAECTENDSALTVDIDLAILGTSPDVYGKFEQNVRKEYRLIPGFIYKKKRKEILKSFLDRESIYHHDYFKDKYESQARENLAWAINKL